MVLVKEDDEGKKAVKKVSKSTKDDTKGSKDKEPTLADIPGVGPGAIAKLEAAGIYDLMAVAVLTPPSLAYHPISWKSPMSLSSCRSLWPETH